MALFERLKSASQIDWTSYVDHEFVRQLGEGTLPEAAFRKYLIQDYLFLIQFARAWALAAYKSRKIDDIQRCQNVLASILSETALHVRLCEGWGISREMLDFEEELAPTVAYTRFVLDCGASGDLLELMVALSPCVVGYAEIGKALALSGVCLRLDHPYAEWINAYACDSYQSVARDAVIHLDELGLLHMTELRFDDIRQVFAKATRLEAEFWTMGLA